MLSFTSFVVFALVWWTVLFAVLPIGVQPDVEGDPATGGWRGAPQRHRLGIKVMATTAVALLIWLGIELVVASDWLSFRSGWLALPEN